jgi:hypothetical protein
VSALALLHGLVVPAVIHIGGATLPVKAIPDLLQDVVASISKRETPEQAALRIAPNIVPILLTATNIVIPYAGLAVTVVIFALAHSKPPTPADQQRMWDRAQGIP